MLKRLLYREHRVERRRLKLVAALIVLALFGWSVIGSDSVKAAAPDRTAINNITKFCKKTLPAHLRSACDKSTIRDIYNAANKQDDTACGGPDHTGCITDLGNQYIREALSKHPTNPAAFKSKLRPILAKAKTKGVNNSSPAPSASSNNNAGCSNGSCVDPAADPNASCTDNSCDLIKKYVNPLINLLSLCFGLIAAGSIIYGGIMYSMSQGDSQKVTNAKQRIYGTLIAVVSYMFLYSFLQFLVPGGVFNR